MAGRESLPYTPKTVKEQMAEQKYGPKMSTASHTEGKGIVTRTRPTLRERGGLVGEKFNKFTAPAQLGLAVVLAPFSAGASAALLGGAFIDTVQSDYAEGDKKVQQAKRLLKEAEKNKHKVTVVDAPKTDGKTAAEVAMKPGSVEVLSHNADEKETKVRVIYEAAPHETKYVAVKKKDEKTGKEVYKLAA